MAVFPQFDSGREREERNNVGYPGAVGEEAKWLEFKGQAVLMLYVMWYSPETGDVGCRSFVSLLVLP